MSSALKFWLPYKLKFDDEEIQCEWLYVGNKKYSEPFFESTILDCKNFSENQKKYKSVSSVNTIVEFSENTYYVKPTAFIFHISRCGSTLLSQLLSLDNENIVVSEAPFLDDILNKIRFSDDTYSEEKIIKIFQSSIKYYGRKRTVIEQNFYIKLDSWHIMCYDIIRKSFPFTPLIFLYRKPYEVINSHKKQPGMQAIPGLLEPAIFGIEINEILLQNQVLYLIKVLETYFEKLTNIAQDDGSSLFIDYSEGISAILEKTEQFLKLEIKPEIKNKMIERSHFHSKNQNNFFDEKPIENISQNGLTKLNNLYEKLNNINAKITHNG